MIKPLTLADLNPRNEELTQEQITNANILLPRINAVWEKYCEDTKTSASCHSNSGIRTWAHHVEVYKQLAFTRGVPFDINAVPKHSKHLIGAAVDIRDWGRKFQFWCLNNIPILEAMGLWMEHPDDQERVHLQCLPPKSGNRVFIA